MNDRFVATWSGLISTRIFKCGKDEAYGPHLSWSLMHHPLGHAAACPNKTTSQFSPKHKQGMLRIVPRSGMSQQNNVAISRKHKQGTLRILPRSAACLNAGSSFTSPEISHLILLVLTMQVGMVLIDS